MTKTIPAAPLFFRFLKITIVITFAFLFFNKETKAENNSYTFTVKRIRSNELIETKTGLIIHIPHISAPDKDLYPNRFDACYHLKTKQFLISHLVGHQLTVEGEKKSTKETFIPTKINLENGEDLSEVMIGLGLAQNRSELPDLIAAEKQAQEAFTGLWQRCGAENKNQILAQRSYKTHIPKSIRHNFQEQSSGTVQSIISNNVIELDNGLKVQIWGLKPVDKVRNQSPAHQCFGEASQNYLETKLLHKTIVMEKPRIARDSMKQVERLVYIDEPLQSDLECILESTIKAGYGLLDTELPSRKHQKSQWQQWAETAIRKKNGAWGTCAREISKTFLGQDMAPTITQKLNFDPLCPIKGNVTGTKANPIKKYHTVASPWYQRTQAEECFETEEAAIEKGFVKVK